MKHIFYVSPNGLDTHDGLTRETAFQTPKRARQAVREARKQPLFRGAEVIFMNGVWTMDKTLTLEAADSGIPGCGKVVWRADEGAHPVFSGARRVEALEDITDQAVLNRLNPEARNHVKMIDLTRWGVSDAGCFALRGGFAPAEASHAELFSDNVRQPLARWPREGYVRNAGLVEGETETYYEHNHYVTDSKNRFNFSAERPCEGENLTNIALLGYWTWEWADCYRMITEIDRENKIIRLNDPNARLNYIRANTRFCAINVLEEISAPGDFAIDFEKKRMYWWPENPESEITVSCLTEDMIRMTGVTDFELKGITLRQSRGNGLTARSCARVTFEGLSIENVGNTALIVEGGSHVRVSGCEFTGTGDGCVQISGGDLKQLIPCGHEVTDCHFHHFSVWSKTYKPAIRPVGCGLLIARNVIHDAPHSAILFNGADMRIEENDIYRVALETNDVGAIYTGRSIVQRGNVIRANHIHDMAIAEDGFALVMGIYLDDFHSGQIVIDNVVEGAEIGLMIGGGRDNLVEGNLFIHCKYGIHLDARGTSWARYYFVDDGKQARNTDMQDQIRDYAVNEPPFADRYPMLKDYLADQPELPKYNRLNDNEARGCVSLMRYLDDMNDDILENNEGNRLT